ncbi:MAG TPA: TIGR04438 family Trp-rich protein [Burkholderiales bacterium]|jgi:small Trp-rich protein|nr:TIGR04438 family Trp-rich protein [Burkholderiales bacterium]
MPFLLIGLALAALKYFEVGPFAKLSWLWVALPFVIVVIWWEILIPLLGLDKDKEHAEFEKQKKARMDKNRSGRSQQ